MQVTKYVEREILNHRQLVHPHIVQFKEVCRGGSGDGWAGGCSPPELTAGVGCAGAPGSGNVSRAWMLRSLCSACGNTPSLQVFLTSNHLGIAMEFAAGGDMFEYVVRKGGLRENEARWFFQQLVVAVDYIHRMVRQGARARPCVSSRARACICVCMCARVCAREGGFIVGEGGRGKRKERPWMQLVGVLETAYGEIPGPNPPTRRVWRIVTSNWKTRSWTAAPAR